MVLETAFISVTPGREAEFVAALSEGRRVLAQAPGFIDLQAQIGVERPSTVLLTLRWQTLEDHTVSFREGPLFAKWREVIGPFFAAAPVVEHWEIQG